MKAVLANYFIPLPRLLTGTPLNNVKCLFVNPIKGVMSSLLIFWLAVLFNYFSLPVKSADGTLNLYN